MAFTFLPSNQSLREALITSYKKEFSGTISSTLNATLEFDPEGRPGISFYITIPSGATITSNLWRVKID